MTIQKEKPGIWFATCDKCNGRLELDTDPDDSYFEAVKEIKSKDWRCIPPATARHDWQHYCDGCR